VNSCSGTATTTVTVNQTPAVTSTSVGICTGGSTTLVANADIPGGTYSWNTTPLQSTPTILVQPVATTSYVVTYTAPNNCIATSTSQVTVTDMPSVQLDDISVCEGEMGTLTANPSVPGGIFTWTPGGVGGPTLEVNVLTSTQYSVVYTLNDCGSPADNAIVSVVSTPSVTVPDVTICLGQSATLNATSSPLGGTYQWSTSESNSSILVDPSVNTDYTVTYYLNGCPSQTETVSVTVESIPAVTFDVDYTEGCLPLTVNFTNTTSNSANCTWLFSNGFSIDGCEPISYTFQEAGCFDISLLTSSQNGCSNTTTMDELICAIQGPTADFSLTTNTIGEGNNTVQIQNTSTGGVEYIWNYGDQTTDSLLFNPGSHTYTGNASSYVISLVAISAYGCIDSTSQLITVSDEIVIYAPNTFIPDNDGLNDIWIPIICAGLVLDSYELDIYNRWGEKIFSTKDYLQGWDGTYLGNKVQDGIYSYIIRLRDKKTKYNQIYTGHITLIR
jgi:gliding motility-associated-like protein